MFNAQYALIAMCLPWHFIHERNCRSVANIISCEYRGRWQATAGLIFSCWALAPTGTLRSTSLARHFHRARVWRSCLSRPWRYARVYICCVGVCVRLCVLYVISVPKAKQCIGFVTHSRGEAPQPNREDIRVLVLCQVVCVMFFLSALMCVWEERMHFCLPAFVRACWCAFNGKALTLI